MIQKTNARHGSTAVAPLRAPAATNGPDHWGSWVGRKYYSLEVVQNPIRARMCGFGDKDRRPLAPAAVCKMNITRDDNSQVNEDDIDISFFIVTVDLWSEDAKQEMNLVLHPSSQDRVVNSYSSNSNNKTRRRGGSVAASRSRASSPGPAHGSASSYSTPPIIPPQTPQFNPHPHGYNYSQQQHPAPIQEPVNYSNQHTSPYGSSTPQHSNPNIPTWGYPPQTPAPVPTFEQRPSGGYPQNQSLPSINSMDRPPQEPWQGEGTATAAYRAWSSSADTGYHTQAPNPNHAYDNNSSQGSSVDHSRPPPYHPDPRYGQQVPYGQPTSHHHDGSGYSTGYAQPQQAPPPPHPYYPNAPYYPHTPPASSSASVPPGASTRQSYTRTLVGPLSANACKLNDEHRKPGIFFLFQDLSVRTEGTFRLRLRLMNVGAPPAPDAPSGGTHTDVSPVLAQTFTEPFMVYSAKRFPGVPDTTALSISFGSQGQKLPLRNRHGKQRKRRRGDESDGSDDEDDGDGE